MKNTTTTATETTCGASVTDACLTWTCQNSDCTGNHMDRGLGIEATWTDGGSVTRGPLTYTDEERAARLAHRKATLGY